MASKCLVGKLPSVCSKSRGKTIVLKASINIDSEVDVVVVSEDINLEGSQEYLIKGKLSSFSSLNNTCDRIFCPDSDNLIKRNLFAATSIARCDESGSIPVRLISMEPRTLYKGTRLGIAERTIDKSHLNTK